MRDWISVMARSAFSFSWIPVPDFYFRVMEDSLAAAIEFDCTTVCSASELPPSTSASTSTSAALAPLKDVLVPFFSV